VSGPANLAKGSTLRATLDWLAASAGPEVRDAVLARLDADDRRLVQAAAATEEYPFALWSRLSDATQAEVGGTRPDWPERAGAHAIESLGVQLYGGILRKASPLEFLTQSVSLFRLYYQPGDMKVVEVETAGEGAARAVLRLVGFAHDSPWFCRRQTGGLERATTIAGGEQARVRHVRCALAGDAFCEWELRWERPTG
jgi:hypothetical protein